MNSAMQVRAAPAGRRSVIARSNKKVPKVDVTKQGLERVKKADPAVYHNLQGRADKMKDKKWKDASGSQGARDCTAGSAPTLGTTAHCSWRNTQQLHLRQFTRGCELMR